MIEKNNQLEAKQQEQEAEIKEQKIIIEELEEQIELERENHMEFVDTSKKWHDRKVFEMNMKKDVFITDLKLKVQELEKILITKNEKLVELTRLIEPKPKKFQQFRKLANTTKERVHIFKEKVQEKFHAYILQKNK